MAPAVQAPKTANAEAKQSGVPSNTPVVVVAPPAVPAYGSVPASAAVVVAKAVPKPVPKLAAAAAAASSTTTTAPKKENDDQLVLDTTTSTTAKTKLAKENVPQPMMMFSMPPQFLQAMGMPGMPALPGLPAGFAMMPMQMPMQSVQLPMGMQMQMPTQIPQAASASSAPIMNRASFTPDQLQKLFAVFGSENTK